jgi:hypothetical protein
MLVTDVVKLEEPTKEYNTNTEFTGALVYYEYRPCSEGKWRPYNGDT